MVNQVIKMAFESHFNDMNSRIKSARKDRDTVKGAKRKVMSLLKMIAPSQENDTDFSMHVSATYNNKLHVVVSLRELDSLKCNKLMATLWAFENWDNVTRSHTSDFATLYNRDYHFRYENGMSATVCAYIKSDSETCKRVVTGTKVIEEFALKCE